MRRRPALATVALALLLAVPGCGGGSDDGAGEATSPTTGTTTEATAPPAVGATLRGSVGPGFDIALTADGAPLTTLSPGTYPLEVQDSSGIHNFRLVGPGVDVATGVGDEGPETFEVALEAGTYRFFCDPHASTMNGSFEVVATRDGY